MDLKQYRHQPDANLFDNIQRRLRRRKALRRAGLACAVAAVVVGVWVAIPRQGGEAPLQATNAMQSAPQPEPVVATAPSVQAAPPPAAATPVAPAPGSLAAETRQQSSAAASAAQLPAPAASAEHQPVAALHDKPAEHPAAPASKVAAEPAAASAPAAATVATASETPAASPASDHLATAAKSETDQAESYVWAPNVIIPDGDVEENRTFHLKFHGEVSNFKIFIYNRGGRRLFNSVDPTFTWDATYNGSRLPQGAYVWVAQFRDAEGRPMQKKGTVTVLR